MRQLVLRISICATVLSLALLLTGCSKQDSETYFPLSDGAYWEYSMEVYITGGSFISGKMKTRVDGEERINGEQYIKVVKVTSGIPDSEPEINYYRTTNDGIYFISKKHINHPEQLYLPASLDVGSSWSVQTPDSDIRYTIEAIEDAELFDRKYENSLRIVFEGTEDTEDLGAVIIKGVSYYAPSVGVVKTIFSIHIQGQLVSKISISMNLEEYEGLNE
jgi:hypothetical protein